MLNGKNAIITGGVRGIGRAIAEEFAKRGANVFLTYRSNDEAAAQAKADLSKYGTAIEVMKADAASYEEAGAAVEAAIAAFGKIDILINNAGITKDKLLMRMTPEDFNDVINTNLSGSFYFVRQIVPHMIKRKEGRIINISSIVGVKGSAGQVNYSASKAGLIGLTLSAAKELGRRGITVNAIAPGYIETDMTGILTDDQKGKYLEVISLGRIGKPEDVAKAAAFFASDDAAYITGQVLGVDGGMMI